MNNDRDKLKDHSVFKKNFTNDPFREENFVYMTPPEGQENQEESSESPEEKRSVKGIFRHASKQIIVSVLILVLGFFALNWSAYYQIAKSEIQKLTGTKEESPLIELAEMPDSTDTISTQQNGSTSTRTILRTTDNPEAQKRQIPDLNIEVTPVDNRLVIPRIDQNIPVVRVSSENLIKRDWGALEADIQDALKGGVVHYPGTSLPGQNGNVVITGHSSYFPWDPGRFKDVFALLHDVVVGDRIVMYYDQDKFIYEIEEIEVVLPEDIRVLEQSTREQLTLITCTPVGTNLKRLIVTAKLITPTPDGTPAPAESEKVLRT